MRVTLDVTKGPAAGKTFTFEEPAIFIFGRGAEAHCSIPSDGAISRNHFMIQLNPPDCTLLDLRSSNGTRVNDTVYGGRKEKVPPKLEWKEPQPMRLRDGDRIAAGKSRFRVGISCDLVCEGCGERFVLKGEADLAHTRGVALCEDCAAHAEGPTRRVTCARCARDVTEEAGVRAAAGRVDYICHKCRSSTVGSKEVRAAVRARRASGVVPGPFEIGDAPRPPEIEGFEYLRLLGVGGMGAVYLARSERTGEALAIKIMLPGVAVGSDAAAVFEREAKVAGSLTHPNVVRVHGSGRAGPVFYCIMEYVAGTDAEGLLAERGGRVPRGEAVEVMLQALDGLACAHERGIVHRDVKPANILLEGTRPPWAAKVTDFGLAKSFEEAGLSGLTMEGAIMGSFWYMPREQIVRFRWVRPTADVYAAGATLYHMLTGSPPKRGLERETDVPALVRVVATEAAVPIRERDPSVPKALAEVIDASLSDEEAHRYRNAREMREALLGALGA